MSNTTKISLRVAIIVVLLIGVYLGFTKINSNTFGAVNVSGQLIEDNIPYYRNNGGLNTNLPELIGADVSITGGTLNVTTSNVATSTVTVGCIQTVATSTATPITLSFTQSVTASTTFSGQSAGFVMFNYGTCPSL